MSVCASDGDNNNKIKGLNVIDLDEHRGNKILDADGDDIVKRMSEAYQIKMKEKIKKKVNEFTETYVKENALAISALSHYTFLLTFLIDKGIIDKEEYDKKYKDSIQGVIHIQTKTIANEIAKEVLPVFASEMVNKKEK